jgi:hypothetical protein
VEINVPEILAYLESIEILRINEFVIPILNLIHLFSMAIFVGSLLMVDLRLLNRVLIDQPVAKVARDAHPWLVGSFLMLIATGIPAAIGTASLQYYSLMFRWKMLALFIGIFYTFVLRKRVAAADPARVGPVWPKLLALGSMTIWMIVAVSARLIMLL